MSLVMNDGGARAREVMDECVSWLEGSFGDVLNVERISGMVERGIDMSYRISVKGVGPHGITGLVGVDGSGSGVGIVTYPVVSPMLEFMQANGEYAPGQPRETGALFARLDVGSPKPDGTTTFVVFGLPLCVGEGGEPVPSLQGFYSLTHPAYIKVILRTLLNLEDGHDSESEMTPAFC
jgi:hypothetical protein